MFEWRIAPDFQQNVTEPASSITSQYPKTDAMFLTGHRVSKERLERPSSRRSSALARSGTMLNCLHSASIRFDPPSNKCRRLFASLVSSEWWKQREDPSAAQCTRCEVQNSDNTELETDLRSVRIETFAAENLAAKKTLRQFPCRYVIELA